jgi:hypothetical protein
LKFALGGTVFQTGGSTGAAHVQVGVRDGAGLRTAYSGTNGNFWVFDNGTDVDWANAEVRMRNADGEVIKDVTGASGCNSCHTGGAALIEP